MNQTETIFKAVVEGNAPEAKAGVEVALQAGVSANEIMQDGLVRDNQFGVRSKFMAGIRITVPTREATARHIQADAVAG